MHNFRRALAALLLFFAAAAPVLSITLQPGTYKLEWRIPAADEIVLPTNIRMVPMKPMSEADSGQFQGLISSKCYCAAFENLQIVLDESRGTDTGYDTAYLAPVTQTNGVVDLESVPKLALTESLGQLIPADSRDVCIDVPIGEVQSRTIKRCAVDLDITVAQDSAGARIPAQCVLKLRGGWYGKVSTDAGDMQIQTCDMNLDGTYNNKLACTPDNADPEVGDAVIIGDTPKDLADFEGFANFVLLGSAVCYDGKLYTFDISAAGDEISIQPYLGDAGTVQFIIRDGHNKPSKCTLAAVTGASGRFGSGKGADLTVPVGNYGSAQVLIMPESNNAATARFGFAAEVVQDIRTLKVQKGKTVAVKAGGPLSLQVEPWEKTIKIKRGKRISLQINLAIDHGSVRELLGGRKVIISVKSSKGGLMMSQQGEFDNTGACTCPIDVPKDWKIGSYALRITFDPSPYQGLLSEAKTLKVM